ncbi:MAG TPA: hypothetical protein VFV87_06830 [Pirellulaceae bacterium]|nr:hypothetical protein [Pirellulaceae bacterium]
MAHVKGEAMLRGVLLDLWPFALALAATAAALAVLARSLRPEWRRQILARLHRDEVGGVQSVSFVLAAPVFVMLMLLAVQITQLMIGLMIVHYAAYAAARSATVWIPARMEPIEQVGENRIGNRVLIGSYAYGSEYLIEPGTPKYEQIRTAAALACLPIAPSRDIGIAGGDPMTGSIQALYASYAPAAMSNGRIPQRLANKWAYANAATEIEIHTFHRNDEPPLIEYPPYHRDSEFKPGEIGWRDQIRVTVTHKFALLPGPGRLLARRANESRYPDRISPQVLQQAGVYYVPLSATATMVGEGEKSVRPYVYVD